jgi:hypothetical protein
VTGPIWGFSFDRRKDVEMMTNRRIWIPLAAATLALAAFSAQSQETSVTATLTGAAQLPEPVVTTAEGVLKLVASADGKKLSYTLTVTNLRNPAAADMHLGPPIANGPLVARLFPTNGAAPKKGDFSGVLVEGTSMPVTTAPGRLPLLTWSRKYVRATLHNVHTRTAWTRRTRARATIASARSADRSSNGLQPEDPCRVLVEECGAGIRVQAQAVQPLECLRRGNHRPVVPNMTFARPCVLRYATRFGG